MGDAPDGRALAIIAGWIALLSMRKGAAQHCRLTPNYNRGMIVAGLSALPGHLFHPVFSSSGT